MSARFEWIIVIIHGKIVQRTWPNLTGLNYRLGLVF
jgi:hypothetical protein